MALDKCTAVDCNRFAVATAENPIEGGKTRVCRVHALVLDQLDSGARIGYAAIGDPRVDRPRLVVWDEDVN